MNYIIFCTICYLNTLFNTEHILEHCRDFFTNSLVPQLLMLITKPVFLDLARDTSKPRKKLLIVETSPWSLPCAGKKSQLPSPQNLTNSASKHRKTEEREGSLGEESKDVDRTSKDFGCKNGKEKQSPEFDF